MILITGALGFVGRNLVLRLLETGREFVATDTWPEREVRESFGGAFPYQSLDITNAEAVETAFSQTSPQYVIHLAAHPLPASIKEPVSNAQVNIIGSLNLLEASRRHEVKRVIFASASSIVGKVERNPVSEDQPCLPQTPYGVAKYAVEHYLRVFNQLYGLDYLVFRFFNVYGPHQRPESGALVPLVMSRIIRGEEVFVFGDGSVARDFVFVDDVVDFLIKALEVTTPTHRVLNLGTGRLTTIAQVIEMIGKVVGCRPKVVQKSPRPGEITNFSADTSRLREVFGEVPSTDLLSGLQKTFHWLKEEIG